MNEPKTKNPKAEKPVQKEPAKLQNDLERCPRCGLQIENIVWGRTDCPNCGLHFECC